MSSNDEPAATAKPKESQAFARSRIKKAMAEHLRDHGNEDWWTFREHPDHAPWIGKAAGVNGDRQFYRWKGQVQRIRPTSQTRPHADREIADEQLAWANEQLRQAAPEAATLVSLSPRHIMHGGGGAIGGIAELAAVLARCFVDIERVRQAALVDDPNGFQGQSASDPKLLLKAVQVARELALSCIAVFREYNSIWALEDFHHDLIELLSAKLAGHPELAADINDAIEALVHRHGGVPQKAA